MTNIIMRCISSYRMRITWNEEATEEFSISRGICQGRPLSPYLFVLCMDRLAHTIDYAISLKKWKHIKLNKRGLCLSHLFFIDDLILFAEADLEQVRVIQTCLNLFCSSPGEKVNKDKTHLYCSHNVHPNVVTELSRESGFSMVPDLGKYLGIPLHHRAVNRA